MSNGDSWTVGRLLTWTTDYLQERGADTPRLDAEILLAKARNCRRIELYTAFDQEVGEDQRATFRELVRRRAAGEPVAYLVGFREFYSLNFRVTPAVLIPRPETEDLIVQTLDLVKQRKSSGQTVRVLDVGTGSGAIAISIAKHAPHCHVTAIDVSASALELAQENAATHQVSDRVVFRQSDLLEALADDQSFDIIVSNPPYVSQAEWEQLPREVKDHEPVLALVGGTNGTELISQLVEQAASHLHPGGWLLIELSPMIAQQVLSIATTSESFNHAELRQDLSGRDRVLRAQRQ